MSFKINYDLDFFWSISEGGGLKVELAKSDNPEQPFTDFVFDRKTLIEGLQEDIKEKYINPNTDITEWIELIRFLRNSADELEETLKESFE